MHQVVIVAENRNQARMVLLSRNLVIHELELLIHRQWRALVDHGDAARLASWMAEAPHDAPFPAGTLLWFSGPLFGDELSSVASSFRAHAWELRVTRAKRWCRRVWRDMYERASQGVDKLMGWLD